MASEETQALKPGKFTLNLEKTTRRKHNLSNFRERMGCDKKWLHRTLNDLNQLLNIKMTYYLVTPILDSKT